MLPSLFMGQPVKLSDEMILEARVAGAAMGRSIAGQVEFWASLGRAMERVMTGSTVDAVRRRSSSMSLSESIETVNGPKGRERLAAYLNSRPYPRFVADPVEEGVFVREDADGSRTPGRFAGRSFVPQGAEKSRAK
jgi:hypothetical protein